MLTDRYVTYENKCALTTSLWSIMLQYYIKKGSQAYEQAVPYTVTNMRTTAAAHAQQIIPYFKTISHLRIIDVGAGIGQHGFHLANALLTYCLHNSTDNYSFELILADPSPCIIEYWHTHPQLKPLIEKGIISTHQLTGNLSQDLQALNQTHPIHAYIFNYVLDSLPFIPVINGLPQKICLKAKRKDISHNQFIGQISDLKVSFSPDYSKETEQQLPTHLYKSYQDKSYTFPITAIEIIKTISQQTHTQVILVNDKGHITPDEFSTDSALDFILEGCYSAPINFHALLPHISNTFSHTITGQPHNPMKSLVIHKNKKPHTMSCAEVTSICHYYKHHHLTCPDHALALCKILEYDAFTIELISQATLSSITPSLEAALKTCLAHRFVKNVDFTLLHLARIYRNSKHMEQSLHYLQQYKTQQGDHSALNFELGLHFESIDSEKAIMHLNIAAQDPLLNTASQNKISEIQHKNLKYET